MKIEKKNITRLIIEYGNDERKEVFKKLRDEYDKFSIVCDGPKQLEDYKVDVKTRLSIVEVENE